MPSILEPIKRHGGLVLFTIVIVFFLVSTWNIWMIWYTYSTGELYNYLIVVPIVLLIIYLNITGGRLGITYHLSAGIALLLVLFGLFLLVYAPYTMLIDQYLVAGVVLILASILVLFMKPVNGNKYWFLGAVAAVIVSSLIMVPLPPGLVFDVSAYLTRYALSIAVPLAKAVGTPLSSSISGGVVRIIVDSPNGPVRYDIAPICSGIIGLLSVLAVAPLLIVASLRGSSSLGKRIAGGVVGVSVLAVLMFLANSLRLALVFYTTSVFGREVGYGLFHYTPEIVLVFPIAFIALKAAEIFSGKMNFGFHIPRFDYGRGSIRIFSSYLLLLLLLVPITLSYDYSTPTYVFANMDSGEPMILNKLTGDTAKFVDESIGGTYSFSYLGRIYEWEKALSPTTRIHLYRYVYMDYMKTLDIYIEFSEQASGLHVWEICLPWQNITIYNTSWPEFVSPDGEYIRQVWLIQYGKGGLNGVLVYWRDKVYTTRGVEYFRLTVMLNSFDENITRQDIDTVRKLAYKLWLRTIDVSYSIRGIRSIGLNYYTHIVLPVALISLMILYARLLTRRINRIVKKWF